LLISTEKTQKTDEFWSFEFVPVSELKDENGTQALPPPEGPCCSKQQQRKTSFL
jgi:hypothetical protein